jgi:hypothetical protein
MVVLIPNGSTSYRSDSIDLSTPNFRRRVCDAELLLDAPAGDEVVVACPTVADASKGRLHESPPRARKVRRSVRSSLPAGSPRTSQPGTSPHY